MNRWEKRRIRTIRGRKKIRFRIFTKHILDPYPFASVNSARKEVGKISGKGIKIKI